MAYTGTERTVMLVLDLVGPATVDEVIAWMAGPGADADRRATVREAMHRLAVFGDIEHDGDGMWRAARFA